MMVMMSVVVMMVMSCACRMLNVAVLLVAMLTLCLKLKRYVSNAVLRELFPDLFLYFMSISACDYVHRSVIALSVHTPDVNVVNVKHTVDLSDMLAKLGYLDTVRRFFKEEVDCLLQILDSIYENKYRDANRHDRVNDRKVGKAHYKCADEYDRPAEDVLKHV